jgi:hypothetical protein
MKESLSFNKGEMMKFSVLMSSLLLAPALLMAGINPKHGAEAGQYIYQGPKNAQELFSYPASLYKSIGEEVVMDVEDRYETAARVNDYEALVDTLKSIEADNKSGSYYFVCKRNHESSVKAHNALRPYRLQVKEGANSVSIRMVDERGQRFAKSVRLKNKRLSSPLTYNGSLSWHLGGLSRLSMNPEANTLLESNITLNLAPSIGENIECRSQSMDLKVISAGTVKSKRISSLNKALSAKLGTLRLEGTTLMRERDQGLSGSFNEYSILWSGWTIEPAVTFKTNSELSSEQTLKELTRIFPGVMDDSFSNIQYEKVSIADFKKSFAMTAKLSSTQSLAVYKVYDQDMMGSERGDHKWVVIDHDSSEAMLITLKWSGNLSTDLF